MVDKYLCTGCMSCVSKCPKECINIVQDDLGFLYPQKDLNKCINCGICMRVCPVGENKCKKTCNAIDVYYAVIHRDEEVRRISSSGGAFTALANTVLDMGGAVYGASMSKDLRNVEHIRIDEKEQLTRLQGSKYISGTIDISVYNDVEQQLQQGRSVLFSGTPCQIGALNSFMAKPYENLYLVDVICHGVPSPSVWGRYLEYREKQVASKAVEVEFRNKRKGWNYYSIVIKFKNGREYKSIHNDDLYLAGFLSNLYLRESCFNCQYRGANKVSDITLGDLWHVEAIIPEWNDDKGVSLVHTQTIKGQKLFSQIKSQIDSKQIDIYSITSQKITDELTIQKNHHASEFASDYSEMNIINVLKKYYSVPWILRLKRKMWRIIH